MMMIVTVFCYGGSLPKYDQQIRLLITIIISILLNIMAATIYWEFKGQAMCCFRWGYINVHINSFNVHINSANNSYDLGITIVFLYVGKRELTLVALTNLKVA